MNQSKYEPSIDGVIIIYKRDIWRNLKKLIDEGLSGRQHKVVCEHYWNDRSCKEIAEILNMEERTVLLLKQGAGLKLRGNYKLSIELRELFDDLMQRLNKT